MNWETYLALGDSITIGARSYLGYPEVTGNLLQRKLKKEWNVVNYAECGIKAIDLSRKIDHNFQSLKSHQASICSILIGTNDAKEKTRVEDFGIGLNQVIIKAKILSQNNKVVIFKIPEFPVGVMYPYDFAMNDMILEYNAEIEKLALRHQVQVLDLEISDEYFLDGVHLNEEGTQAIGKHVSDFILRERGF